MEKRFPKRREVITKKVQLKAKKLLRSVIEEGTAKTASKIPIEILGKLVLVKKQRCLVYRVCKKSCSRSLDW